MGITRNMIRRYEKKGVISKNEEGKDGEFDEEGLRYLWFTSSRKDNAGCGRVYCGVYRCRCMPH